MDQDLKLPDIVRLDADTILAEWLALLKSSSQGGRAGDSELRAQGSDFLAAFADGLAAAGLATDARAYAPAREVLADVSRSRALQGMSPSDTARFVFSLKEPLAGRIRDRLSADARAVAAEIWAMGQALDSLGLYTTEVYQKSREEVIIRQQQEIAELSTPVVKLWDGILALPLIGTLDSARTQVVMENLLQTIVDAEADIARAPSLG
jgi:rsbT co-antagonist protein RsbR